MAQTMHNHPRWWIPEPLAPSIEPYLDAIDSFSAAIFPINLRSAEERAWRDAVAWLEAREAAKEEWPWPKRS